MKNTRQTVKAGGIRRRWRRVAFLGLAALYVQALLPLFIALAIPSVQATERHGAAHTGHHSLVAQVGIAQHGAAHAPALPAPQKHRGHHASHGDCVLCLGLQLGGPAALPTLPPLPIPTESREVFAAARGEAGIIAAAPVHYASRAPPQLG